MNPNREQAQVVFERTHDLVVLHQLATHNSIFPPVDIDILRALNS
jgi:hypothetical protein